MTKPAPGTGLPEPDERYKALYMSLMDGYCLVDMEGRIRDSNQVYRNMTGYTEQELEQLTYSDLTPPSWHEFEREIVDREVLVNAHSRVYQKEYIRKDGTVFPIELRTFLLTGPDGTPQGMWAIVRDITERKKAEEALVRSEEKYRSIVESSPNGMHFYTITGKELILTGANPSADRMLGISHAELIGKTIEEAFPNLAGTSVPDLYRSVAQGALGPQSFDFPYRDNRISGYYSVRVFRNGPGSVTVDFSDITERRTMEEALHRSEIEYRDTIDSIPDWIYVVDSEFRIVMVNASLRQEIVRSGLDPDCLGCSVDDRYPFITPIVLYEIRIVFSSGIASMSEHKSERRGREVFLEYSRVPVLKDGEVDKVIMMVRDRSKEYEIEELKRRNSEQKEVLLREIHHRVKNNLAIVISLLNFQIRNNRSEELNRMILDIQMRIRSMALIHEHLYRSEDLDRIPLASYIDSLAYMIATAYSGRRVNVEKELEAIDVSIETALPIGLIINELLTNAFKYAFPAGEEGDLHIRLARGEGQTCLLDISDNGVGLPDSATPDSGKSLGLYIVSLLVAQLDGTLEIDRSNGTAFHITFLNLVSWKD